MNNKIDINKVNIIPKSLSNTFGVCVYGDLSDELKQWVEVNNLSFENVSNFTNIYIPNDLHLSDLFIDSKSYEYMDGFSPNLNKFLHIGHFSNLVIAKSIKALGICNQTVSIYGDTLSGDITNEVGKEKLIEYQKLFNYHPDLEFLASSVKYEGDLLVEGEGEYLGTKIFKSNDDKMVGIKSDGSTSYFYQDMALAHKLDAPTLYLTGSEQCNHFELLNKFYNNVSHIGLGLVKIDGKKMSSRLGNVIFVDEFINIMKDKFNDDMDLIYNVFAGYVLKVNPSNDKNIELNSIENPKNSPGLYLSYTVARLKSAGCVNNNYESFTTKYLEFALLKAKNGLKPSILFSALVEYCKEVNMLYATHIIKDSEENKEIFEDKLSNLLYGFKLLGLFDIKRV